MNGATTLQPSQPPKSRLSGERTDARRRTSPQSVCASASFFLRDQPLSRRSAAKASSLTENCSE